MGNAVKHKLEGYYHDLSALICCDIYATIICVLSVVHRPPSTRTPRRLMTQYELMYIEYVYAKLDKT